MTPQSHPHSRHVHRPRGLVRRSAVLLAGALVIVGAPVAASAIGGDPIPSVAGAPMQPDPGFISRAIRSFPTAPDLRADPNANRFATSRATPERVAPEPSPTPAPPAPAPPISALPAPDPAPLAPASLGPVTEPQFADVLALLSDTYAWDERSDRVALLQEAVEVEVDGWYAAETQQAHRGALEFLGLPIDGLPAPVLPSGLATGGWAALRQCESGGDYSIASGSGTYRGAYQFDRSTWNSVAERHASHLVGIDPAAASPADQDAMALALYSERGARPWPHCGRHLS